MSDEFREYMRDAFGLEPEKLGATGRFPEGKLNAADEGEIRIGIGRDGAKVLLDFGTPVAWVGMTGQQAIDLGQTLLEHGRRAASIG